MPPGDPDCDGYPSASEVYTGTLPLVACPATGVADGVDNDGDTAVDEPDEGANDEDPDAWPVDFNDDQAVDVLDLLGEGPSFKKSFGAVDPDPLYFPRFDLSMDGQIDVLDLLGDPTSFKMQFGLSCTP